MLGQRAVPALVKLYQKDEGWDEQLESVFYSVFRGMGKRGQTAIEPLLKIANDETAAPKKRTRAIAVIGAMHLAAERAVPDLQKLQQSSNEDIRAEAEFAIANIGTAEAVPILLKRIEKQPNSFDRGRDVRQFSWLGTRGKSAGPAVVKYLADENWDPRRDAALTLGCIGYDDATDNLIKALADVQDWRLVLCAARALQLLKAERALRRWR